MLGVIEKRLLTWPIVRNGGAHERAENYGVVPRSTRPRRGRNGKGNGRSPCGGLQVARFCCHMPLGVKGCSMSSHTRSGSCPKCGGSIEIVKYGPPTAGMCPNCHQPYLVDGHNRPINPNTGERVGSGRK